MGRRDNRDFQHIVVSKCRFESPCELGNELKRGGGNLFILLEFLFGPQYPDAASGQLPPLVVDLKNRVDGHNPVERVSTYTHGRPGMLSGIAKQLD